MLQSFFFLGFTSSIIGLTHPRTYNPMRWLRCLSGEQNNSESTLDRFTIAGLLESVVSSVSGPPPKTAKPNDTLNLNYIYT